MADQSKDDLVKALEALSAATPAPDEHETQEDAPQAGHARRRPLSPLTASAVLRPSPGPRPAPQPRTQPARRSLELKRTIIPVLLTLGVILPATGTVTSLMGDESPLGDQTLTPMLMIVVGVLIAIACVLTMLQVRHVLSAKATG